MVKEIKSIGLWLVLTTVAILFGIASSTNQGFERYIYFIVSIASCYLIRLFAKKETMQDG